VLIAQHFRPSAVLIISTAILVAATRTRACISRSLDFRGLLFIEGKLSENIIVFSAFSTREEGPSKEIAEVP
jgi:hypothetical protein